MSDDRLTQLLHELDDLDVALPPPAPVRARGRALRRRRQAAAVTGGVGLAIAGVAAAVALSGGSTQTLEQLPPAQQPTAPAVVSPAPTAEATSSPAPSEAPVAPVSPVETSAPADQAGEPSNEPTAGTPPVTSAPPAPPSSESGTSPAYLRGFQDGGSGTVLVVDRVQFLTGADAQAYAEANGRELDTEFLIVNDNPQLREHPVSPDAEVLLTVPLSGASTADPVRSSLGDLRSRLAGVGYGATIPFDVTLEDGVVVRIAQIYVP